MSSTSLPTRRKRACTAAGDEGDPLQVILRELRDLREEQQRMRADFESRRQEQTELRPGTEQQTVSELSTVNSIIVSGRTGPDGACAASRQADTYDGTAPLREYLAQFSLVARANNWSEAAKAVALASSLRGKARSILSSADLEGTLDYGQLASRLELRFGEVDFAQNAYIRFTNRRQNSGEDVATFGAELERLCRSAYPESPQEVREKIACAQFVSALADNYIRRSLQTEGVTSLRAAIERAKTLKVINENCFPRKREESGGRSVEKFQRENAGSAEKSHREKAGQSGEAKVSSQAERGNRQRVKECWQCGARGHFRAECPAAKSGNSASPN